MGQATWFGAHSRDNTSCGIQGFVFGVQEVGELCYGPRASSAQVYNTVTVFIDSSL